MVLSDFQTTSPWSSVSKLLLHVLESTVESNKERPYICPHHDIQNLLVGRLKSANFLPLLDSMVNLLWALLFHDLRDLDLLDMGYPSQHHSHSRTITYALSKLLIPYIYSIQKVKRMSWKLHHNFSFA